MKPTNTKALVEGALLAAINIVLSIMALYMPILGSFATLVWPVPIVILGIRHGLRTSILATAVAGIIVAILSGPFQALSIVISFGLIGIAMGGAINKKLSPFKVLAVGGAASLISKVILIFLTMLMMGINPITEEINIMKESLLMAGSLYEKFGMDPQTVETTIDSFNRSLELLPILIPGIFIMASVMDTFLTYVVTKAVLARMGQKLEDLTPFALEVSGFHRGIFSFGLSAGALRDLLAGRGAESRRHEHILGIWFCLLHRGFFATSLFPGQVQCGKTIESTHYLFCPL